MHLHCAGSTNLLRTSTVKVLLLTSCLCLAVQAATPAVGSLGDGQHSALGDPVGRDPSVACAVTLGVFVRGGDNARFVADTYGVHVNVRFGEITEVASGSLDGRRAYVFVTRTYPGAHEIRTSSWRDSYYPRHPSEGPTVSAISVTGGPLRGDWTLTECRNPPEP
jgi:hypothetical protein